MASVVELLALVREQGCVSDEDLEDYMTGQEPYSRPFVISLAKDVERYERSSRLLQDLGTRPIRFSAIEGAKVEGHRALRGFETLKAGERGCLASHLCILALASRHQRAGQFTLVFEDDVVSSLRGDALKRNLEHLSVVSEREDASLVHLGKCFEQCGDMLHVDQNVYRSAKPYCTHALAIKNGAARQILSDAHARILPLGNSIDDLYRRLIQTGELVGLSFHPSLFYQDVLQTTSNLRPGVMDSYTECLDAQVHPKTEPAKGDKSKGLPGWFAVVLVVVIVLLVVAVVWSVFGYYKCRRSYACRVPCPEPGGTCSRGVGREGLLPRSCP
jgi:hypothetical protein